jgi:hypothetical protein
MFLFRLHGADRNMKVPGANQIIEASGAPLAGLRVLLSKTNISLVTIFAACRRFHPFVRLALTALRQRSDKSALWARMQACRLAVLLITE